MEELIKFLRVNKVLTAYMKAFKKEKSYSLAAFCEHANKTSYISGAFPWEGNNKNIRFWIELNNKWRKSLKEKS